MIIGWNIFAGVAALTAAFAAAGAGVALYRKNYSSVAMVLSLAALFVLGGFIVAFVITLGRPPMRTMGETRLWYSFFMLLAGSITYARWRYRWVLSFSTIMASVFMIINILRPEIHDATLMPALQSVWFVPHVAVYMFSYSLLGCATLLAVYQFFTRNDLYEAIDRLIYAGVAFFTIGMLTGALWAKEAWGEFWSWDAKESWAAVTWMLYMLSIHLRLMGKTDKRLNGAVLIIAFLALQMCWYGVNYLPSATESIHIYNR
ncbi:MAG: cytochrome c biogenesis protein CcsA [Bacteroidaceae bacterium]|nr:cytochrome c biogenesis protein CcsA [Bacteroidaceae bacterium]